jgi:glycosyltransferase involved in cell wall biosynthesis
LTGNITKILLVTHYFSEHGGGIEIVADMISRTLLANNGNISITWCASDECYPERKMSNIAYLPIKTYNFFERYFSLPFPILGFSAFRKLYDAVKSADIIHLHDYIYPANMAAFMFSKILRKPVLITQHIGYIPYKNIFVRSLLSLLNRTFGKIMLKYADKTVFISELVMKYFYPAQERSDNMILIPNGVDHSIFHPVEEERRRELRLDNKLPLDTFILLFVGRFVEKKGLPILKELVKRIDNVLWVFIGWGDMDPGKWNEDNVIVFRQPEKEVIASIYKCSDLLVLPSEGEGFPLVVQEAMASGTPVIVNEEIAESFSPVKEVVYSVSKGMPDNILSWNSHLEEILKDPNMVREKRLTMSKFAQKYWSWEECAKKYFEIYQKIYIKDN